jgi:hypothetical protein
MLVQLLSFPLSLNALAAIVSASLAAPVIAATRLRGAAFASKKSKAITARLIVRRVKDLNRKAAEGQDELLGARSASGEGTREC